MRGPGHGEGGVVGTAGTGKRSLGVYGASLGFGPGGRQGGEATGKVPGRGSRARISGVSVRKAQLRKSPKGCLGCLLREKIAILGSSVLQEAAFFDFQQMEWGIGLLGVGLRQQA